jgi:hypothetical protein
MQHAEPKARFTDADSGKTKEALTLATSMATSWRHDGDMYYGAAMGDTNKGVPHLLPLIRF